MSDSGEDVRVQIAVLSARFEAANSAHQATLEAIKTLLLTEQANFRAAADARFTVIEKEVSALKAGVEEGKLDRARTSGRASVIAGFISVGIGVAMLALSTFVKSIFG